MKVVFIALLVAATAAWPAAAGDLRIEFDNGYVTLSAHEVPLRQVLTEWSRRGQTRFVNAEKVMNTPVTLELTRVPEKQALEVVLHSVAGYMAAPRETLVAGASSFDRVVVLATSSAAPPGPASRMPGMGPYPQPQPQPMPMQPPDGGFVEDTDDPVATPEPGVMPGGEGMPNGFPPGYPNANGNVVAPGVMPPPMTPDATNPLRGYQPPVQNVDPNANPQQVPPPVPGPTPLNQGTVTAPGPGQLPVPPQQPQQPNDNAPPQ